jgi:cell cycle checkpoint control protein RAD9A
MLQTSNSLPAVLKKPLQTSIAVEVDEFDDIDVEDKLHIVISVKDFRAIIQHAGITGNEISARYSIPAKPIQLSYSSDAISCEFLIMTVGERGSNPAQKTKKGRKNAAQDGGPRLEAASRRESVAPMAASAEAAQAQVPQAQTAQKPQQQVSGMRPPVTNTAPHIGAPRASASRIGAFDLRPSQHPTQRPPPPTMGSQSLFVDDEGWEPVGDEDEDQEDDARLEWDHSAETVSDTSALSQSLILTSQNPSTLHMSRVEDRPPTQVDRQPAGPSSYLEPTQKLSDVKNLALFPD